MVSFRFGVSAEDKYKKIIASLQIYPKKETIYVGSYAHK